MISARSAMTWMSDSGFLGSRPARDNGAKTLARARLARVVHPLAPHVIMGLVTLALASCVIPPSLSVEKQDASVDSPPGIVKVLADTTPLFEGQTVTFAMATQSQLVLSLVDTDLGDTLTARVFVAYSVSNPTPPRAQCVAPPNAMAQRDDTSCPMIGICQMADIGKTQDMTVVVFDRALDDGVPPVYQYDGPDGLSASKLYHLTCTMGDT